MGCSKPYLQPCPSHSGYGCQGCEYFTYTLGDSISYMPQMAKFISQFTNEELIAELQRRLK